MPKHFFRPHFPLLLMLPAAFFIGCAAKPSGDAIDLQLQRMRDPQIGKMLTEIDRRQIDVALVPQVHVTAGRRDQHVPALLQRANQFVVAHRAWFGQPFRVQIQD